MCVRVEKEKKGEKERERGGNQGGIGTDSIKVSEWRETGWITQSIVKDKQKFSGQ